MNNFAISSTGIGEALQRSASALYEAGNTIDESVALITAANSVVQNPEQVGTALKTLALRLRGTKTELEEAGEDTDGMAESVSQLQAKLKALTHGKVDIMVDADTFKNTTEILREMSDAWSEMTDLERASALELMGGKRQANILSSIITNFQTVEDVIKTSSNASGSALAENEKYLDSIQGRIDLFTNSLQTMWMNFIDSNAVKFIVDMGTAALKLVDALGLLPTVIGGFSAIKLATKDVKANLDIVNKAIQTVVESKQAQTIATEVNAEATKNESTAEQFNTAMKNANAVAGMKDAVATNAQVVATKALAVAKGLLTGIGKGLLIMGVSIIASKAFEAIYKGIDNVIHRSEKLKEEVQDLKEAYEDAKKTFDDNLATLTTSSDTSVYATLEDEFRRLTKGVDQYGNNISLTSDQYERYKEICEKIVGIQPSIAAGYDSATKAIGNNANVLSQLIELQKIQARQNTEKLISDEAFTKIVNTAKTDYTDAISNQTTTSYENISALHSVLNKKFRSDEYSNAQLAGGYDRNNDASTDDEYMQYILQKLGYEDVEQRTKIVMSYRNAEIGYNYRQFLSDYYDRIKANTEKFGEDYKVTLDNTFSDIEKAIVSAGEDVKEAQDSLVDTFLLVPQGEKAGQYYDQLNDASKKFITEWIKNGSQFKIDNNQTEEAAKANRDKIIDLIKDLAKEDFTTEFKGEKITGQDLLDQLYDFDMSTVNWSEYREQVNEYIQAIWKLIGGNDNKYGIQNQEELRIAFGIDFTEETVELENAKKIIAARLKTDVPKIEDYLENLSALEVKAFYTIDWNEVPTDETQTWTDVYQRIKEQIALMGEVFSVQTYSDLSDSFDNFNEIQKKTEEIVTNNTEVTQEYKDSLIELGITQEELNECFDENNTLVVKDAKALKNLVQSTKLNIAQNVKLAKSQARLDYYNLYKQLYNLTHSQENLSDATIAQINSTYKEMSALQKSIAQYGILEQKLLGATNAYEKFANAQEVDSENDYGSKAEEMVGALADAFRTTELGSESAQAAIEGLVPESVFEDCDTLDEKMQKIYDYFTGGTVSKLFSIEFDDDGGVSSVEMTKENLESFVDTMAQTSVDLGNGIVGTVFEGSWDEGFSLNKSITSLEQFADACNMTEEVAFAFLTSLEKYDISWLDGDLSTMIDQLMGDDLEYQAYKNTSAMADLEYQLANNKIGIDEYIQKYNELSKAQDANSKKIVDNATSWIEADNNVEEAQQNLKDATTKLNSAIENNLPDNEVKKYQTAVDNATTSLAKAVEEKQKFQEPTEMTATIALESVSQQIEDWKKEHASIDIETKLNKDYELNEDGEYVLKVGAELDPEFQKYVDLINKEHTLKTYSDTDSAKEEMEDLITTVEEARAAVEKIPSTISIDTSGAVKNIDTLIERLRIANQLSNSTNTDLTSSGDQSGSPGQTSTSGQRAINQKRLYNNMIYADGTVHTGGSAFKGGSFGAPKTETSLVGELGPEMLVRDGKWTTVGENGAEFTQVKKGDIIFNHKQTEDLLSKGYVTSRGKAYAGGTAYASLGSIRTWSLGSSIAKDYVPNITKIENLNVNTTPSEVNTWDNGANIADDYASSINDAADEFEEVFDWIEVRLEEINEDLDYMNAQLENAVYYTNKNNIIDSMIDKNKTKISNLTAGIKEYTDYAAKLLAEVPAQYRDAAQNGMIAITEFAGEADEATVEAIENYREWAQKAADLNQQLEETKTTIRDLAIEKFNNAYDAGDVRATVEDSQTKKLQNAVDYDEERGLITSDAYYIAMMENSNKKIEYLTNAREAMQKELDDAVKAGQIIRGSNEWYELIDQMYQIQSEIDEATIELEQFQNAINDLYWDNFDELINRLDYLSNETQNLIDLMDSADMVTKPEGRTYEGGTVKFWTADDVQWTEEGIASLGLYAQQMEIAEYKAKQYAEAIDDLTKDYQAGKYSENEYLEKLNELKDAQYDAIESYYDAQDAIKELNQTRIDAIKDGISKEIDAYEELISKKKEELNAEKDLYDFQKSTAEQQKNIADIQRKLASLSGDNSASAIAQRKKLEAELAEAKADLEDSYYQRSIEDRSDALDKELEDFQDEKNAEIEKWDEYLENIEQIVADSLGIVQANASGVYDTLSAKAQEYDLTLSDAIMTPWQDGALAVSDYQSTFDTAMSSTMDQLEALKNAWQEVIDKMAEAGEQRVSEINEENANYAAATYVEPAPSTPSTPNNSTQKTITVGGEINASGAKIYSYAGGQGYNQYFASDPIYTVLEDLGNYIKVRHHKLSSGVTGFFKKSDVKAYATGTKKLDKSGLVNIDELGEELVIGAKNGRLTYLEKGSGVIPADLTSNLMEWGQLDPQDILDRNRPEIKLSPEVHNTEINLDISYGDVLHIDEFNGGDPDEIAKIVAKQLEKNNRDLNNALRRFAR